jgi:hypothetical protein
MKTIPNFPVNIKIGQFENQGGPRRAKKYQEGSRRIKKDQGGPRRIKKDQEGPRRI